MDHSTQQSIDKVVNVIAIACIGFKLAYIYFCL